MDILKDLWAIKERQSLETVGMTWEEKRDYHNKGAQIAIARIEEIRKQKAEEKAKSEKK